MKLTILCILCSPGTSRMRYMMTLMNSVAPRHRYHRLQVQYCALTEDIKKLPTDNTLIVLAPQENRRCHVELFTIFTHYETHICTCIFCLWITEKNNWSDVQDKTMQLSELQETLVAGLACSRTKDS